MKNPHLEHDILVKGYILGGKFFPEINRSKTYFCAFWEQTASFGFFRGGKKHAFQLDIGSCLYDENAGGNR